jgi:WD40 repeat protein/serine/threonine protein kinase
LVNKPRKASWAKIWPFSSKDSKAQTPEAEDAHEPPETVLSDDGSFDTAQARPFAPGEYIAGLYEVKKVIPGGMGFVYIARDKGQNLDFAIKQPKARVLENPEFLVRVIREADAWTRLGMHPNIAYCYFVRLINGVPFIFVEFVEDGTLRGWIMDKRAADFRNGLRLAIEVCHGMEKAHAKGMIHRDIKPENILMTSKGSPKICDFGLVGSSTKNPAVTGQNEEGSEGGTLSGAHMGTPPYMSPEQWEDPRQRDGRAPQGVWRESDVFSFGVCLWEMFLGRRPYAPVKRQPSDRPPDPAHLRPGLSPGLRTILLDSIALDRTKRIADFAALREQLNLVYHSLYGADSPTYRLNLVDTAADELNNQGYSLIELGQPKEGRKSIEQALEADPGNPHAVYNLGLIQYDQGEIDDREVFKRLNLCRGNPKNQAVVGELTAHFLAHIGDPDAARAVLRGSPGRFEELFGDEVINRNGFVRELSGHDQAVASVAVSPDGRYGLSAGIDGRLACWQLATGELLGSWQAHAGGALCAAISGNGRMGISGGADRTVKLWELSKGSCLATLKEHGHSITSVAISADGRFALSGSTDMTLCYWDLSSQKLLARFLEHTFRIHQVAMSADGHFALSLSLDNTLYYWGLLSGKNISALPLHSPIHCMTMQPDGKKALLGDSRGELGLWDLTSGRCESRFLAHEGPVQAVAISANSRFAVSLGREGAFKMWQLEEGRCLRTLACHKSQIMNISICTDGHIGMLTGPANKASVFEAAWEPSYRAPLSLSRLMRYEFKLLEKNLFEQKLSQAQLLADRGHNRQAHDLLLLAWRQANFSENEKVMELYRKIVPQGRIKKLVSSNMLFELKGHRDRIRGIAISQASSSWAISASYDMTARRWDLATGRCLNTLRGHTDGVSCVAITPDDEKVLTGGLDKTVRVWSTVSGQALAEFVVDRYAITALAIVGNSGQFLSGSEKFVHSCRLDSGKKIASYPAEQVTCIRVSADGIHALWPGESLTAGWWNLSSGSKEFMLTGHRAPVLALEITSQGRFGVSADADGVIKYWHFPSGKCLATLTGHKGAVNALALSHCGTALVSGGEDKTLRIWDLVSSQQTAQLHGKTGRIGSLALSPDGLCLLAGDADGGLVAHRLIWELEFASAKGRTSAFGRT